MIDLHSHILHGLDDGALDLGESVAMARAAVADGIRAIAATPHVREDYPTSAEEMEHGVRELREALAGENKRGKLALQRSRRSGSTQSPRNVET